MKTEVQRSIARYVLQFCYFGLAVLIVLMVITGLLNLFNLYGSYGMVWEEVRLVGGVETVMTHYFFVELFGLLVFQVIGILLFMGGWMVRDKYKVGIPRKQQEVLNGPKIKQSNSTI